MQNRRLPRRVRVLGSMVGLCLAGFAVQALAQDAAPERPLGVRCLSFSPDGKLLAVACSAHTQLGVLVVWDVERSVPLYVQREPEGFPRVAFSPDGELLAVARFAPEAKLLEARTGRLVGQLEGHENFVRAIAFTPDGKKIVTGSYDRTIKIWDRETRALEDTWEGHESSVYHVDITQDGSLLASADSQSSAARLWELPSGRPLHRFDRLGSLVPQVAFSPAGELLAICSWTGGLHIVDTCSGELRLVLQPGGGIHWACFSPDHRWLAVTTNGRAVYIYDGRFAAPNELREEIDLLLQRLDDDSYDVREEATESLVAVGLVADVQLREALVSESPEVRWRARRVHQRLSGREGLIIQLMGHEGELESVCFSPDSQILASGDLSGNVKLWRVSDWSEVAGFSVGELSEVGQASAVPR